MNPNMRKPISSFALTQCTYNQPTAAIEAYGQFLRQSETIAAADGVANLIIIDSSPQANAATRYYEYIADKRVTYLHIPTRPEYADERALDAAQFLYPKAYSWRKGEKFHHLYQLSMPSDEEIRQVYIEQDDVIETLKNKGPRAYKDILHLGGIDDVVKITKDMLVWVMDELFSRRGEFYPKIIRPHLSSKRQLASEIASAYHCDMLVHLDDDFVGSDYVRKNRLALANADVTGQKHYPVMIRTADMEEPVWAIADLTKGGTGYVVGFDGKPEHGIGLEPAEMQGWSLAHRVNGALPGGRKLPPFAPLLYGEDSIFLRRANEAGFTIAPQVIYDPTIAARGIIGHSNSNNNVNEILTEDDERMPSVEFRTEAQNYYNRIVQDFVPARGATVDAKRAAPDAGRAATLG